MCVLSSFIHNASHNPPEAKVMSYGGGVITLSDIWQYCWHSWVGFLCLTSTGNSFHIQNTPASLLTLQPHSSCSFSALELEARRKVRDLNHGELCWVAQVRAFLIFGFVLSE